MFCFGSQDKYAQGLVVPLNVEPTGNLSNVFVCGLTCDRLRNDAPFPIGVRVGQMNPVSKRFEPFGDTRCTHESVRYHCILPPSGVHQTEPIVLYRNTARINHYLGRKYPWLHEKEASTGI